MTSDRSGRTARSVGGVGAPRAMRDHRAAREPLCSLRQRRTVARRSRAERAPGAADLSNQPLITTPSWLGWAWQLGEQPQISGLTLAGSGERS
jgi:hypothetical protein